MAKSKEKTHAEKLLDLVKASGARFFRDQYDRPHARIRQDGHWEIRACSSEGFETWLTGLGYRSRSSFVPNRETLGAVLNLLKAKARFEGERHHLYNRVALYEGHIYYDLADERWRAVEVSECGWRIVDSPPILFRRHGHQG
ncbi:MAG TPA: hypothetical protein VLV83_26205, partial [Acidobacteriota bacterium]|nr:hypothetical protein [Acidobacteriota bacterium]